MSFSFGQYEAVFGLRDSSGKPYVMIGGQAVNYWAEVFLEKEPLLKKWRPFTSRDIDFHGNREDVTRVAAALGLPARFPHQLARTALAGMIPFKIDGNPANIEIVRLIPGIKPGKIEAWAITARRGQREIETSKHRLVGQFRRVRVSQWLEKQK